MPWIKGKMYDIRQAKEVCYQCSECGREDKHYYNFGLYQKEDGELFICGIGGSESFFNATYSRANGKLMTAPGRVYLPLPGNEGQAIKKCMLAGKTVKFKVINSLAPISVEVQGGSVGILFSKDFAARIYRERRRKK